MRELIKSCKQLERKAQREMVNHLSPYLYPICRRYEQTHEDAKDLLQESLITIFNNIEECKATEAPAFKSWCRRITINNALAKKRKKKPINLSVEYVENEKGFAPKVYSQLHVEEILKLLNFLPENQRLVFNLAVIDGYSHKEISEVLGIKESSSRTFLVRGRQLLKDLILKEQGQKNTG